MAELVDLSIPVRHGEGRLGLEVAFETPYRFEACGWRGSTFSMFCHYATHVDAPNHFLADGNTIDQAPLDKLIGPAAVIELADHGRAAAISGDALEDRGRHAEPGDIAVLRTGWTDACWGTDRFWREGPYLAPDGADWLVERGVKAVVYDFAEEYEVRKPGFRGEDCIVHHRILSRDIYNIEYVHNLAAIARPRCTIIALPIKLVGLDGAPARVLALEGAELPTRFSIRN
ncbi:MAG: cyclase family protein [Alphaproteobacteria bacterium]|jgi:arylformamidase|nr:cyclase family protein [Alphaproteobacteria bacterium]